VKDINSNNSVISESKTVSETIYVNSKEGLRVRSKPDINSEKIFLLNDKQAITVLNKDTKNVTIDGVDGSWYLIQAEEAKGWVFSGYTVSNINDVVEEKTQNLILDEYISEYANSYNVYYSNVNSGSIIYSAFEYLSSYDILSSNLMHQLTTALNLIANREYIQIRKYSNDSVIGTFKLSSNLNEAQNRHTIYDITEINIVYIDSKDEEMYQGLFILNPNFNEMSYQHDKTNSDNKKSIEYLYTVYELLFEFKVFNGYTVETIDEIIMENPTRPDIEAYRKVRELMELDKNNNWEQFKDNILIE
jgi:hypothetical protein